tara:strand:- start:225 stop:1028 length:804 start_codon:yes stop_codon:yes gene_type:complete
MPRPDFIPEDEWVYIVDYLASQFVGDYDLYQLEFGKELDSKPIIEEKFRNNFDWHFGFGDSFQNLKKIIYCEFKTRGFFVEAPTKFSGLTYQITRRAADFISGRKKDPNSCIYNAPTYSYEIIRAGFFNIISNYEDKKVPSDFEYIASSLDEARMEGGHNEDIPAAGRFVRRTDNAWNEPDYEGEIDVAVEEKLRDLINQCIENLPKSGLSNSDQAQAVARLEAADKLANAPVPQWGSVRDLLAAMVNIAVVGASIAAILNYLAGAL